MSYGCCIVIYMTSTRTAEQLHGIMQEQTLLLLVHTIDFQHSGSKDKLDWLTFLLDDIKNLVKDEGAVPTKDQARRIRDARREVRNAK
jgi:hypothetical protein